MVSLACIPPVRVILKRGSLRVFVLAAVVVLAPRFARAEPGENSPRYHLNVGQKIEYRATSKSDRATTRPAKVRMNFWVVGENPDQSWKLLYPALVLIDQQGIVRHFDAGYSPTFHDDLAARIRELLAAGTAPAADPPDQK